MKQVVIDDMAYNERRHFLSLTEEQFRLLKWIQEQNMLHEEIFIEALDELEWHTI